MIPLYKTFNKFLSFLDNLTAVVQIVLTIIVFLTAGYWFLDLIGVYWLNFVAPLAISIIKFMHTFYHQQIEINGQNLDGALLLFDIIIIALIIGLAKFKNYISTMKSCTKKAIILRENRLEEKFNEQLKKETEHKISKLSNVAILIEFELQNCQVNDFWGGDKTEGVREKTDEAFKDFNEALKTVHNIKVAKTDNKMLILCESIDDIDKTFDIINNSTLELKRKFRKKRWIMNFYASASVYGSQLDVKNIYPLLSNLLNLKIKNEILTMGDFSIRYGMIEKQSYNITKKGHYELNGEDDVSVWAIIKKF